MMAQFLFLNAKKVYKGFELFFFGIVSIPCIAKYILKDIAKNSFLRGKVS
ncbi:hypothetical protein JOD25_000493 [Kurthia huakuii]|nr:hypothetical protein [Kurthia huakuii]